MSARTCCGMGALRRVSNCWNKSANIPMRVPKEKNRTNRIQRCAEAQSTTDGAHAPAAVCAADDGRGTVRRIVHDHSAQFAAILCRSRCLFSVAKALYSTFWSDKRNNSAPNKPRMCERRSLGLFRQMRRRTALRIARPLREPAMLRAGCALANVRRAARRARPTRLTSTHKWCVQQCSIARQRVRASHQPLHSILAFSFETASCNLFLLIFFFHFLFRLHLTICFFFSGCNVQSERAAAHSVRTDEPE